MGIKKDHLQQLDKIIMPSIKWIKTRNMNEKNIKKIYFCNVCYMFLKFKFYKKIYKKLQMVLLLNIFS